VFSYFIGKHFEKKRNPTDYWTVRQVIEHWISQHIDRLKPSSKYKLIFDLAKLYSLFRHRFQSVHMRNDALTLDSLARWMANCTNMNIFTGICYFFSLLFFCFVFKYTHRHSLYLSLIVLQLTVSQRGIHNNRIISFW